MFPVRYKYHLHIQNQALPLTDRGGTVGELLVRYENHLHINNINLSP
jgi:hypothetical protein